MSGFNIGIGLGLRYASRIYRKKGGASTEVISCFNQGMWFGAKPWLMDTTWSMASLLDDYDLLFLTVGYDKAPAVARDYTLAQVETDVTYSKTSYDAWNAETSSAQSLYKNDTQLVYAPLIDMSRQEFTNEMFYGDTSLLNVPLLDTSKVKNGKQMFLDCSALIALPKLNLDNLLNGDEMFYRCTNLKTIPQIRMGSLTSSVRMFYSCNALSDLGGFLGLKCNLDLSHCPLAHDSIINVINGLFNVSANPKTLTLGASNLAKISDKEIQQATNKGWILN